MKADIDEILNLPVDERLEIMEKIWESLSQNEMDSEIPQWHKEILEERFQAHRSSLNQGRNWGEVKKNLLNL